MNEKIRELFENHTVPNFGPFNGSPHKNFNGEYHNPVIEDHWQTFQEAAELIIFECTKVAIFKNDGMIATADVAGHIAAGRSMAARMIKEHFGVE